MTDRPLPLIGIPATPYETDGRYSHRVSDKYIFAAIELSGCLPILIPAVGGCVSSECLGSILGMLDGLLLTGGRPNVEPHRYGGSPSVEGTPHCPERDATTLPLIRAAVDRAIPVFAVCLGVQELNVALGGTLHQRVQDLDGKRDHRMNRDLPIDQRFEDRHPIEIRPGGVLARILGRAGTVMVNSLHAQAVDRPGGGVFVDAVSDDGVIEAISVPDAPALTFGVQWHPEHPTIRDNAVNGPLFWAFGEAVRSRRVRRVEGAGVGRAA